MVSWTTITENGANAAQQDVVAAIQTVDINSSVKDVLNVQNRMTLDLGVANLNKGAADQLGSFTQSVLKGRS